MRTWRLNSLTFLLTGRLLFTPAFIFLGVTAVQLSLQASYARRYARSNALALAEALYGSLHTSMLANDRNYLREAVAQITQRAPNVRVRIFNKDGTIVFSSQEKETGQRLDPSAEACYRCHAQGQPIERLPAGERTRAFSLGKNEPSGPSGPSKTSRPAGRLLVMPTRWKSACWAYWT